MKNFFKKRTTRTLAYFLFSISLSLGAMNDERGLHPHGPAYVPLLQMGFGLWTSARIDSMIQVKNKEVLQQLQSEEALNEFRDNGTIEGKKSRDVVSDSWAENVFKPLMNELVSRTVSVQEKTEPIEQLLLKNVSPDGMYNIFGHTTPSNDHVVRIYIKKADGWELDTDLLEHLDNINSAFFSNNGMHILTASDDNLVGIWTKQSNGSWGKPAHLSHSYPVDTAYFNHNNTKVISTSADTAYVWTKNNRSWSLTRSFEDLVNGIISATFSLDGTNIVTTSKYGTTCIWTQLDLVGNDNVASKIMLLQLLKKDKTTLKNRPHLQAIFNTFDPQAKEYLTRNYNLAIAAPKKRQPLPIGTPYPCTLNNHISK